MSLTPEQIQENFAKFRSLCEKLGERTEPILKMIDELGERLALAPASSKETHHLAYPGGLVEHSLHVLKNAFTMMKTFGWDVDKQSIIICCLFHDLGKVGLRGDSTQDFYVMSDDAWRVKNLGETYKYNNNIPYFTTPDRTMFILNQFGIQLSPEEWLAIRLNDGLSIEENRKYGLKVSKLSFAVMTADYISTCDEKGDQFWD